MLSKIQFAVGNGLPCLGGSFVRYVRSFAIAFSGHLSRLHTSDVQSKMIVKLHCPVNNNGKLQVQMLNDLLLFPSKTFEQNPLLPDYGRSKNVDVLR